LIGVRVTGEIHGQIDAQPIFGPWHPVELIIIIIIIITPAWTPILSILECDKKGKSGFLSKASFNILGGDDCSSI